MAALMSLASGFLRESNSIRDERAAKRQQYVDLGLARIMEIDKERRAELKRKDELYRKAKVFAAAPNAQGSADDYAALLDSGVDIEAMFARGMDPIKRKPVQTPATGPSMGSPMPGTTPMAEATQQPPQAPEMPIAQPATAPRIEDPMAAVEAKGGTSGGFERALFGKRGTEGVGKELRGATEAAGINYDETMTPVAMPELSPQAMLNIRRNPLLGMVAENPALLKHLPTDLLDQEDLSETEALKLAGQAMTAAAAEAESKELSNYRAKKQIDLDMEREAAKDGGKMRPGDQLTQLKLGIVEKVAKGEKLSQGEQTVYDDIIKKGEMDMLTKMLMGGGMAGLMGAGTDMGTAGGTAQESASSIPDEAAQFLKENPEYADQFDEKYGPGSAAKILGR